MWLFRQFLMLLALLLLPLTAAAFTPNDPLFSSQWGFSSVGLPAAWDYSHGGIPGVKVAVIDNGFNYYIDDFAETNIDLANAWDFWSNDSDVTTPQDHGTHVLGTIAQSTNNGIGAAGAAFSTTILPLKVFPDYWSSDVDMMAFTDGVADAIKYAVRCGADVINMSIGVVVNENILEALDFAYSSGTLVVAATGNLSIGPDEWLPADPPANLAHVLPVGALESDLSLAHFSQMADGKSGYGLVAPGVDIVQVTQNGDEYFDGTSMASPMVAGVAALTLSYAIEAGVSIPVKGSGRVDWLRGLLSSTAQDLGDAGPDSLYGYGMVRADQALAELYRLSMLRY